MNDEDSTGLLRELFVEATLDPDDPFALWRAIQRRIAANAAERRMLEQLHDLEIARLHDLQDPETGVRLFHQKNIAAEVGRSVAWVSKSKTAADPGELKQMIDAEVARLHAIAADEHVPGMVRISARTRARNLSIALERFTARTFTGAASLIGGLWLATKTAALVKSLTGGASAGGTTLAASSTTLAAGGAAVPLAGIGGTGLVTGGGLSAGLIGGTSGMAAFGTAVPAVVQAGVLAIGTYTIGAPIVEELTPPPVRAAVADVLDFNAPDTAPFIVETPTSAPSISPSDLAAVPPAATPMPTSVSSRPSSPEPTPTATAVTPTPSASTTTPKPAEITAHAQATPKVVPEPTIAPAPTLTPTASPVPPPEPTIAPSPTPTPPEPSSTPVTLPAETAAPKQTATAPPPEPTETTAPAPTPTAAPEPTGTAAPEPTPTAAPEPTETAAPEPTETTAPEPPANPQDITDMATTAPAGRSLFTIPRAWAIPYAPGQARPYLLADYLAAEPVPWTPPESA
ncbi:hypothetical protein [Streptosporangium roseum]|uniref:hypothetical protein n=1 Tax=Streptosporangium roseum TaxID=2001 RepID=UPI003318E361